MMMTVKKMIFFRGNDGMQTMIYHEGINNM